ncbi:MAG: hypothetical protein H6728_05155 [Myxococcales bacterium]|nr:hypothetical protein [Myxococcales bacterium]
MSQPLLRISSWLGLLFCCFLGSTNFALAAPPTTKPTTQKTLPSSLPTSRVAAASKPAPVVKLDPALFQRVIRKDLKSSEIPFPLELPVAPARITYLRAFKVAQSMKLTKEDKALFAFLEKASLREWETRRLQSSDVRREMIRYLHLNGLARYRMLAFVRLKKFEEALQTLLKQGGSPSVHVQETDPTYKSARHFARYAGNYPSLFVRLGISDKAKKLTDVQWYWLRTLFMARWAAQVMGVYSLPVLMGGPIYADYTRARILFSNSPERQLWAARELLRIDSSVDAARLVVWVRMQLGQPNIALNYLRRALRKDPSYKSARTLLLLITQKP